MDGQTVLVFTPYRLLASVGRLPTLLFWSLFGRLHTTATALALTFLVTDWTGSYTLAGVVAASLTIGTGIAGPLRGRAADRKSVTRLLVVTGVCYGGGLFLLAALPGGLWLAAPVIAFLTGLSMPPVSQVSRSVWAKVEPEPARNATYAVEATLTELLFMVGPMLASLAVAFVSPPAAVVLCGLFAVTGALGFAAALARSELRPMPAEHEPAQSPETDPAAETDTNADAAATAAGATARVADAAAGPGATAVAGPSTVLRTEFVLRAPGVLPTIVMAMMIVAALIAVDLVVIAWARERGTPELAGILVAVWAAGSLVGGLIAGGLRRRPNLVLRMALVTLGLSALIPVLPPVSPEPSVWLVGLVLAAGGAAIAPAFGAANSRLGELAPTNRRAEAFGWLASASTAGSALAATLIGWVLDVGSLGMAAGASSVFGVLAVLVALQIPARPAASPSGAQDVVT
ncbi:MFS family permease [Actinoalloteichus hoggarensis]|uniref:Major Facilitator Superfamily protein n=1 Tax=Actinoalloteichus hoggarensis TaxID=1470176 RepID=A0A221WB11_9PSEU|nr:MFS transporter [Actinoalloteichus hoggarensis]ASO22699.1 Major Facilitator Superfamily protein [Actinoalloteichus hoggarensis]MBB5924158.1 MFS family permease [Actinoalloteichus hoggarensis]